MIVTTMGLAEPVLPSMFTGYAVGASVSPFDEAMRGAGQKRLGAGDFLWSPSETDLRCAVVLEPDVVFERAIEVAPLAMVAIGDALGAIGPPNLGILYRWPFELLANGALVGRIRMGVPDDAREGAFPDYLVVGFDLAIARGEFAGEPGLTATQTVLHEEGAGELDRTQIIEALARHFLTWLDRWENEGFEAVRDLWLFRAADRDGAVRVSVAGQVHEGRMAGLDEQCGLILKTGKTAVTISLLEAVQGC